MIYVWLLTTGLLTGGLSALLGIGGGIFLVPLLTLLFKLPIRTAIGTSLVGIIATSAGVAAFSSHEYRGDLSLALRLEVATTAGALAGSLLSGWVNEKFLELLFAGVTFFTAAYMLIKARRNRTEQNQENNSMFRRDYHPQHWLSGLSMAGLAGALSGLLGVSGGFIKVPTMYSIMDVPLGIATATSSIMVGITAAASVFIYYARGDIHPLVVIPVAVGDFLGASIGYQLLPNLKVAWLRTAMVALLTILGIQMLSKTFI